MQRAQENEDGWFEDFRILDFEEELESAFQAVGFFLVGFYFGDDSAEVSEGVVEGFDGGSGHGSICTDMRKR